MSFVADFLDSVVGGVGDALDSVVENVVEPVADFISDNVPIITAVVMAAATAGASLAADGAIAASEIAAAAAESAAYDAWAFVPAETVVSPSTWAAFGTTPSTADLYSAATSSAVNTSVADYAAAAVAGESTGAATAFTSMPLQSLGAAMPTAGFLGTALQAARAVKDVSSVMQIVNMATQQKSMIPRNAPVPVGWSVDSRWSPSLGDTGGKFVYDPASGALVIAKPTTPESPMYQPVVTSAPGTLSPFIVLAALAGAILFLVH